MKTTVVVSILLLAFCGTGHAAYSSEVDAKVFVKDASEKLFVLYNTIADEIYTSNSDDEDFSALYNTISNVQVIAKGLVEISKESRKYDADKFKDPELKYALKKLRGAAYLFVLEEEYFTNLMLTVNALKELATDKDIEPYKKKPTSEDDNLAYVPDIQNIFATSYDPHELKYYWETWREKNNEWAGLQFMNLIESIKRAANMSDIPILEFWFYYYEDPNFLQEMEVVMDQLKPFYQQLHAFVRSELSKKYGDLVVDPNGPIPEHIFQQVLVQAWRNGSVIESSYPGVKLPRVDEALKQNDYDALKVYQTADKFYESLGMDPLEKEIWTKQIKSQEESDSSEDSCKADIFDITPKVYMKYCKKVDFKKFLQAHANMGRVHYARQKKDLPFYYFLSYDLEYPVGEAILLSASTPKHLNTIHLLDTKFEDTVMMNRLFRMAIHTMFNIPLFFVHTKVMNDLLSGKIKLEEVNKHYWKQMEDYAGVEPPSNRREDVFDFPYRFYEDMEENHQARKFVSEVLGYQFYRSLCQTSGQLKADNRLHNCDFYGSQEAGNALKAMMSIGSSKPWREVLAKVITDKPGLDGGALLEYYAPIRTWLEQKNKESGAKIGWNHSKKRIIPV